MTTIAKKRAEIKTRTTDSIKAEAAKIYEHWGISLNDAINMFLVKSIEVGGLPFDLRPQTISYEILSTAALHPPIDSDGIVTLPEDWDDDE